MLQLSIRKGLYHVRNQKVVYLCKETLIRFT